MSKETQSTHPVKDQVDILGYWDRFYTNHARRIPSQFAAFVASELKQPHLIIDIGCGNGRDSFFFAQCGHASLGLDGSATVIEVNQQAIDTSRERSIAFQQFVVGENLLDTVLTSKFAREHKELPILLYSRFFLHAIPEKFEDFLITDILRHHEKIEKIYLEYRELQDQYMEKTYGDHYRRFVDAKSVSSKLLIGDHYSLDYQIIAQGIAKYGNEDPWIARQVFSKPEIGNA